MVSHECFSPDDDNRLTSNGIPEGKQGSLLAVESVSPRAFSFDRKPQLFFFSLTDLGLFMNSSITIENHPSTARGFKDTSGMSMEKEQNKGSSPDTSIIGANV